MRHASVTMQQLISLIFISVAVAFASVPPEIASEIREYVIGVGVECIAEVGASNDDISKIIKHQLPETEKGKCFVACVYKKMNILNRSGKIDKTSWYAILDELKSFDYDTYKTIRPMADRCLATVTNSHDECETATNLLGCMFHESKCDIPNGEKCIFDF
uniref:Uncharacterized protein n=1 Tax=Photinus pyralis TaxID=7054 RepID=A0A1Y1N5Z7_PHOPY